MIGRRVAAQQRRSDEAADGDHADQRPGRRQRQDDDGRHHGDRRPLAIGGQRTHHPEHGLGDDGDGSDLQPVQPPRPAGAAQSVDAIGERHQRDGRGQREPRPRREGPGIARAGEPDGNADLARCRPGQELAEGDDVGIGTIGEPSPLGDELFPEIAEMGDRPAERGEAEAQEDRQHLGPGAGRAARGHACGRLRGSLCGLRHRLANQFLVKFAHFRPGDGKRIAALAGRAVVTARAAAHALGPGFEVALALQPMQHRIERSRADPVTVLAQLLEHPVAEELALDRMVQDMQADQAAQEVLMLRRFHATPVIGIRLRISIFIG